MRVLAIETSCDDTSLAIVSYEGNDFVVEQLVSYTQVIHQQYGGIVPELASREHAEQVVEVFKTMVKNDIWKDSKYCVPTEDYVKFFEKIDAVAYTAEPGLPGSLVVGETFAKTLALQYEKPLLPINHIHGHIFSILLERKISDVEFPLVILTASGGHNDLYFVENCDNRGTWQSWQIVGKFLIRKLGGSLDDASGECFDKVARMLGWTFPGGPWISKQAAQAVPDPSISFTRIFLKKGEHMFSFSWMKSQVFSYLQSLEKEGKELTEDVVCAIAWEFQEAVVEVLAKKLVRAWLEYDAKTIAIAGGVSANGRLREYLNSLTQNKKWLYNQVTGEKLKTAGWEITLENLPVPKVMKPVKIVYSTDNGAMIGAACIVGQN